MQLVVYWENTTSAYISITTAQTQQYKNPLSEASEVTVIHIGILVLL